MENFERRRRILELINDQYSVKVTELSARLYVSEATIRRDLEKLEKGGHLKRIYGGAVRLESIDTETPLDVRRSQNSTAKENIALLAVTQLESGSVISLDSSTTVLYLCPHLRAFENLTVLTHGIKPIEELQHYKNINLYSAGGLMLRGPYTLSGEFTRNFFRSFYTDAAFISCKGLSMEHGISWAYDEEAALRQIMLNNTRKRVLLCDSGKFDQTYTSKLFSFELIDVVITDAPPSPQWHAFFETRNIRLLYPKNHR